MPEKSPPEPLAGVTDYLKSLPQYVLPLHWVTRLVHRVARVRSPRWKNLLIDGFVRIYGVDLSEAQEPDPHAYPDFNSFFTRALRPGVRPATGQPGGIASPVDGLVSQAGAISDGRIVQAKGQTFTALELLGGAPERSAPFDGGSFATLYLSPRDYHRVHMPVTGRLLEMVYVPGRLFGVGAHTARVIPRVYARNERVAALFDTEAGPMAVVLVGATSVACIETVWAGVVTPPRTRESVTRDYRSREPAIGLQRGAELGRFNMGSTVVLLFGPARVNWTPDLVPGARVRVGEPIGQVPTLAAAARDGT
jgi:phosphatidylserine decarboxylase